MKMPNRPNHVDRKNKAIRATRRGLRNCHDRSAAEWFGFEGALSERNRSCASQANKVVRIAMAAHAAASAVLLEPAPQPKTQAAPPEPRSSAVPKNRGKVNARLQEILGVST